MLSYFLFFWSQLCRIFCSTYFIAPLVQFVLFPALVFMSLPLLQVFAEGLPQLLRCVIVVCGVLLAPHWGVIIFSTAQVREVVNII